MRIALITDSRGVRLAEGKVDLPLDKSSGKCWIDMLQKHYQDKHFFDTNLGYYRNLMKTQAGSKRIAVIYEIAERLKPCHLAIFQVGHHELDVSWTRPIWERMLGDRFDESCLEPATGNMFFCFNRQWLDEAMALIQSKSKRQLFIGMHSWRKGGDQQCWKDPLYHQRILNMNNLFSSYGADFFDLPMDDDWRSWHSPQGVHYTKQGHKYIYSYVRRYIERMNRTIFSRLES